MLLGDKITKNLAHPHIICHYLWSHSCFFSLLVHYSINSQPYTIAQRQRQVAHLVLVATAELALVRIVAVHRQLVGVHHVGQAEVVAGTQRHALVFVGHSDASADVQLVAHVADATAILAVTLKEMRGVTRDRYCFKNQTFWIKSETF